MLADLDLCGHKMSLEVKLTMHNNSSHNSKKIAVLIVAAGKGIRAGGDVPKQYRLLGGELVLSKTIGCFKGFDPIIVAINADDKELFDKAANGMATSVIGGDTRTASVKAGLEALAEHKPDLVLIHDGARPYLSAQVIDRVLAMLESHQAAVPALPIVDAVKTLDGDAVERDNLKRVQTPQGFHFDDIYAAYQNLGANAKFADDIEVARNAELSIGFCTGDEDNIKLTYEQDFKRMDTMISVTGSGYDVHQICAGKTLFLCGVEIDAGFSLKGHSDADVGLHALTDAILGAICAGDIGDHFPPSDARWKGASSDRFLKFAADLVSGKGGIIDHVDVTLICEKPKVKPHRAAMRKTIADILGLPLTRVSVKATTTEGLGFTGRGEGIAAEACASIRLPDAR